MFICGIICANRLERHCNNQLHTNLSGLFLSFFLQFPQNTGEVEGGKKKKIPGTCSSDLFMSVSSIQGSIYLQNEFSEYKQLNKTKSSHKKGL